MSNGQPISATSNDGKTAAVMGTNTAASGEVLFPPVGVFGQGTAGVGVGVYGESRGSGAGVRGANFDFSHPTNATGPGVYGTSANSDGVRGESQSNQHAGVSGINNSGGMGVYGFSSHMDGVQGWSQSNANAGVSARNTAGGYGVWSQAKNAGYFDGDVQVTGTLYAKDVAVPAQDCAEDFQVGTTEGVEPGTVMVLDETGVLRPSDKSYDRKVAGVISGAGDLRPGFILGREKSSEGRLPLALVGKVYCKVDAQYGPVEVGDLLTTSVTRGHAMKASDPLQAYGAVIGKALRPLKSGQALVPILVALQ